MDALSQRTIEQELLQLLQALRAELLQRPAVVNEHHDVAGDQRRVGLGSGGKQVGRKGGGGEEGRRRRGGVREGPLIRPPEESPFALPPARDDGLEPLIYAR